MKEPLSTRLATVAFGALVTLLVLAPGAGAATRWAEPGGDGPAATCPEADPCDLDVAAEDAAVMAFDEIVLKPGDYNQAGDAVAPTQPISINGQSFAARPRVISSADTAIQGASLRDLEIVHTGTGSGFVVAGSGVERVISTSSGERACRVSNDTQIRDTICNGTGAPTVGLGQDGGFVSSTEALVNVTAIAASAPAIELEVSAAGGNETYSARNVIADSGGATDVRAIASDSGATATITLSSSNYATEQELGPGSASVTNPGTGTNQTAAPQFVNAPGGDFHQAAGSPTINAGANDPLLGSFDFDLDPRLQGPAPDIGADEFLGTAVRYAEPFGDGPEPCVQANPCALQEAVEGFFSDRVRHGDEVVLLGGDYQMGAGEQIDVTKDILVRPQAGQVAQVSSIAPTGIFLDNSPDTAAVPTVRDIVIEYGGGGSGLGGFGGLAERVISTASSSAPACSGGTGSGNVDMLIRDGVCRNTGGGPAVSMGGTSIAVFTTRLRLRNVTAVATGMGSTGISVLAGMDLTVEVDARNIIADGEAVDVSAMDDLDPDGTAIVNLVSSNYATENEPDDATVTDPGSGTNQTAPALFVNAAGGDFHQQLGSPTIDAGTSDGLLGSLDLDGNPRSLDATPACPNTGVPDIGAYEAAAVPPANCAPAVPAAPAAPAKPKKKCKKKRKRKGKPAAPKRCKRKKKKRT